MKELPKVFANEIDKDINNTQEIFYGGTRNIKKIDGESIVKKINNIFASPNHVYKSKVKITYKDSEEENIIVGKTNTHLITIDGTLLKIIDIIDIKRI